MKTTFEEIPLFKLYQSLFDQHHDACFALDLKGNFILFNDAAVKLTGYSKEDALQMTFLPLIQNLSMDKVFRYFGRMLQGNQESHNMTIQTKLGEEVPIFCATMPIYHDNQIVAIVGAIGDKHEPNFLDMILHGPHKILEMAAKGRTFTDVLKQIVHHLEIGLGGYGSICVTDANGTNLLLGAAPHLPADFRDMISCIPISATSGTYGEAAYSNQQIHISNIEIDALASDMKDHAQKNQLRACWFIPVNDFQQKVVAVIGMYFSKLFTPTDQDKQMMDQIAYLTSLIIQHYQTEEKMSYLSHHDDLTGLPNRRFFEDQVNIAINLYQKPQGKLLGLLFLDLDRFRLINEHLGYNIGDRLLNEVSQRIKECIRHNDVVARQGSDEFLILLNNVTKYEVTLIAERISTHFEKPFLIDKHEIFITPSIGISLYPTDGNRTDDLIRKADIAMDHAKKEGRNNVQFYHLKLEKKNSDRLEIENELRKAIEKNEFILHYQPIVDIVKNKITGVEALVRWENPFRGKVPPDKFIPIAEETGMIIPIGELVLKQACTQMKKWLDSGLYLSTISVNISIRQFYQSNLVPMIANIIEETGIDPKCLTIEITESMTMDVEKATTILQDLKSLGVNISIDDFGTGYSSLSYLKKFPIDYLKIDRSFISDIAKNKDDENIATTILLMAQNLGLSVIAEGVETSDQLGILKQHRCDEAQGFLFSRPLAEEEIKQFLSSSSV